jgi:hypothetical protein
MRKPGKVCKHPGGLSRNDILEMRVAASRACPTSLDQPRIEPVHVVELVAAVGEIYQ